MLRHAGPEMRTTAMAARPGAVDKAYIVSGEAELAGLGYQLSKGEVKVVDASRLWVVNATVECNGFAKGDAMIRDRCLG